MRRAPWLAAGAAVLALGGCSRVEFLVVEPNALTFQRIGDHRAVSVIGKNRQGIEYPKILVAWETRDPKVATVDRGIVKAVGPGRTLVIVKTSGDIQAEIPVEVITVEKIDVKPSEVHLALETGGLKLTVVPYDHEGREIRGRPIATKCASQEVCSSSGDTVFPIEVGKSTVDVSVEDKAVTLPVTVVEKARQLPPAKRR